MQFEEQKACALGAIRSRIDQFHAALTLTSQQVRGLLVGSTDTAADQSEALGSFAKGKVNNKHYQVPARFTEAHHHRAAPRNKTG